MAEIRTVKQCTAWYGCTKMIDLDRLDDVPFELEIIDPEYLSAAEHLVATMIAEQTPKTCDLTRVAECSGCRCRHEARWLIEHATAAPDL